jgi:malate dehydrogenase
MAHAQAARLDPRLVGTGWRVAGRRIHAVGAAAVRTGPIDHDKEARARLPAHHRIDAQAAHADAGHAGEVAEIVGGIVAECARYSPEAILIMVTNPLDVMTWLAQKKSGFPFERVIGMAGELDSARYAYFIAEKLGCKPSDVKATVLGGHGDQMVPVPELTQVQGKAITKLLDGATIEAINQRTRDGGAEIVKLLKTGSAYYAPSSSAVKMVRAILQDSGEVIPACVYLKGQYGLTDVYCGVPVELGRQGVKKVIEVAVSDGERKALHASAEDVRVNFLKLKV